MDDRSILETIQDSFLDVVDSAVEYTPRILAAIVLLIIGLIVARFFSQMVGKLVDLIEDNKTTKKLAKNLNINVLNLSDIIAMVVRWAILLVFISAAVDELGVDVLTDTFNQLLSFVPNIFAAALIVGLAIIFSNVIHDIVAEAAKSAGVRAHAFLATAARVILLVFGIPLAAAQLGLDLTIINNNLTVIVAGIMLAFGLAFGLGGRETAGKIVEDLYKNWKK